MLKKIEYLQLRSSLYLIHEDPKHKSILDTILLDFLPILIVFCSQTIPDNNCRHNLWRKRWSERRTIYTPHNFTKTRKGLLLSAKSRNRNERFIVRTVYQSVDCLYKPASALENSSRIYDNFNNELVVLAYRSDNEQMEVEKQQSWWKKVLNIPHRSNSIERVNKTVSASSAQDLLLPLHTSAQNWMTTKQISFCFQSVKRSAKSPVCKNSVDINRNALFETSKCQ